MIVARGYRGFGTQPLAPPGMFMPPSAPKRSAGWLVFGAGLAAAWAGGWLLAAYWPQKGRR